MRKGTAIKGKSDIDLVLVLNEVRSAQDLKRQLPYIKLKILNMLRGNAGSLTILPHSISTTQFSVKFSVQGTREKIDVDLLPTFYINGMYMKYLNVSITLIFYTQ